MELLTTSELLERGYGSRAIASLIRGGELVRLARGVYTLAMPDQRERAIALRRHPEDVLGFESAASVHRLPLWGQVDPTVHVLEAGKAASRRQAQRIVHRGRLPGSHVTVVDGVRVTTIARTIVDIARFRRRETGLIPWEAALNRADDVEALRRDIATVIEDLSGCNGISIARHLLTYASALSESPMESRSRIVMEWAGIPAPVQQFEVHGPDGRFLGRSDFAWPEEGILGEYDGREKYDLLARPGQTPREVMLEEKARQQRMELQGWVFARWDSSHLKDPKRLREIYDQAGWVTYRRRHAA